MIKELKKSARKKTAQIIFFHSKIEIFLFIETISRNSVTILNNPLTNIYTTYIQGVSKILPQT